MSADLRAGVVGAGAMGRNHVRVLSSMTGVKLVGVADPLVKQTQIMGPLVRTLDELLERELDLCVVATPTEDHEHVALRLAAAGVHTLVEKPLALSVEAAERVANAFTNAGLVGAVGHIERFNPALVALRERLAINAIGDLLQITTSRQGPFPSRIRDVGVMKDLATHDVDLACWIGGAPFRSLSAQVAFRAGRPHEDLVAITGLLANGVVTNHLVNWLTPFKERRTVVLGESGAFVADTLTADLTYYANGTEPATWDAISRFRGVSEGDVVRYAIAKPEPLRTQLEALRDTVLGEDPRIVPMRDGVEAVRIAAAAIDSASSNSSVHVNQK